MPNRLPDRELSVYECAIVKGGRKLAVRAALASLLWRGAIRRTEYGYEVTGERSVDAQPRDPLESEIIAAARRTPRVSVLIFRVSRGRSLQREIRDLRRAGLVSGLRRRGTVAGRAALQQRRGQVQARLVPGTDPAWYIAVYGIGQLWNLDTDLARQLGISWSGEMGGPG